MSKQSEAKERQGYTRTLNTCSNCENFTCDKVRSEWNPSYSIERNLRCALGGFKVHKTATCKEHKFCTDKI
jgi:hypothetical protein